MITLENVQKLDVLKISSLTQDNKIKKLNKNKIKDVNNLPKK